MVSPKLLLLMLGIGLVVFSAIAIFMVVSYTPQTSTTPSDLSSSTTPSDLSSSTTTSAH
jgi:hypothetical protein